MFTEESLLSIVFRLFNFGLIIALATYCFKQYISPGIFAAMAKQESEKEHLVNEQVELEQRHVALEDCMESDTLTIEQFKAKFDEWKHVVDAARISYEKKSLERDIELRRQRLQKVELQKESAFQAYVANKVAGDLESSLSTHFEEDKNEAAQYIDDIITFMNERVR